MSQPRSDSGQRLTDALLEASDPSVNPTATWNVIGETAQEELNVPLTTARAATVPRVLAALAVVAVLSALFLWLQRVNPDPGVGSVSVWHCRPGAGNPAGGEMTDEQRHLLGDVCRAAASARFWTGAALLGLGVALAAAAMAIPLTRARRT